MVVKVHLSRCRSNSTFSTFEMASKRETRRKGALTGSLKPVTVEQVTMVSIKAKIYSVVTINQCNRADTLAQKGKDNGHWRIPNRPISTDNKPGAWNLPKVTTNHL